MDGRVQAIVLESASSFSFSGSAVDADFPPHTRHINLGLFPKFSTPVEKPVENLEICQAARYWASFLEVSRGANSGIMHKLV